MCNLFQYLQRNRGRAIKVFVDLVMEKPQKYVLLSPAYSDDAEPVVEVANMEWNLLAVSRAVI